MLTRQICENIIIPNVYFRDSDEELFESNPTEYIRRDIEGSDTHTRRRSACEMVQGLRKHFEKEVRPNHPTHCPQLSSVSRRAQITNIFGTYIQQMLATYSQNPKLNWKMKDAAIYLVISLSLPFYLSAISYWSRSPH